jgi:hypothetical protein
MVISPGIVSVSIDKKGYSKNGSGAGISHFIQCQSHEHSTKKRLGNLLHLIGNIDEPQEHIQRCPQGCDILCPYGEHKRFLAFKPATGVRAGIHLIGEFRTQCSEYVPGAGCRKPEGCLVKRHKDCLAQE